MPNGFLNSWSGGVGGDILFKKIKLFTNFINRVHWSPLKVEFMMPNVFQKWWSGGVGGVSGVVGDVPF